MTHADLPPGALGEVLARAADPDGCQRWDAQSATPATAPPVRLTGQSLTVDEATGEIHSVFDTARRTRRDAAQGLRQPPRHRLPALLRGLPGRQLAPRRRRPPRWQRHPGLRRPAPAAVRHADRPVVRHRPLAPGNRRRPAALRTPPGTLSARRRRGCWHPHRDEDPLLGQPLCLDCFDYPGAVLWNASVGELWRRTTIAIQRQLARLAGLPVRPLAGVVRLSFTRVAEYQARGLTHIHAVLRLDAAPPPTQPDRACRRPRRSPQACLPTPSGPRSRRPPRRSRRGRRRHGRGLGCAARRPAHPRHRGHPRGGQRRRRLPRQIRHQEQRRQRPAGPPARTTDEIADLDLNDHLRRFVTTAWRLGGLPHLAELRLRPGRTPSASAATGPAAAAATPPP